MALIVPSIAGLSVSAASADTSPFSNFTVNGAAVADGAVVVIAPDSKSADLSVTSTNSDVIVANLAGNANGVSSVANEDLTQTLINTFSNLPFGDTSLTVSTGDAVTGATTYQAVVTLRIVPMLSSLTVDGVAVSDGATVSLEANTSSVEVLATAVDDAATVTVAGATGLVAGDNALTVTVTDSNAVVGVYAITLNVAVSTDTSAVITVNGSDVADGEFAEVVWGTEAVEVVVTPNDANATYFVSGDVGLQTGENQLLVVVTAADESTIAEYNIVIIVLPNTDTSVVSVTIQGVPVLEGDVVDVEPLTTDISVEVETVDTDASFEIIGDTELVVGTNDVTVIVTAADGETTYEYGYIVNVPYNTDASLMTFNVAGIDVADADYVTVDPLTTEVEVIVETTDPEASFELTGGTDLVPGENDLLVVVTAADGETVAEYFVVIVVAPNTDVTLESLTVNGEETDDGGVVYLEAFTTEVPVEVVTTDPDATYEIAGDMDLMVGENELVIIVTAADNETTYDYVVTLVVAPSNDATLANMTINFPSLDGDQSISVVDGDEIELPSNTTEVEVIVEPTDPEATFEISGNTELAVGENTLVVTITAADGEVTEDIYVNLIVLVGDVTTSSFTVNELEVADGDIVDVEPGSESVEVVVETTDPLATFEIIGGTDLVLGENELVLVVTSVDETLTVEYKVILNVLPSSDASFSSIEINGIVWEDGVAVDTEAGDIDVVVNTNNEFATVNVTGNLVNASGIQELVIDVTAQDGETVETVTVVVWSSTELEVVPSSSLGDGQLRVGTWIKLPRAQFDMSSKLTYSWLRDGEVVDGATSAKYLLTVEDFGHDVRPLVIATKKAVATTFLGKAVEVSAGLIKKAPAPSIKGKAAVGNTLTGATKDWMDGTELAYQWYRDGSAVDGATSDTYELTGEDFEATISLGITGTLEAYEPLEKFSTAVTIAAGALKYSDKPSISGQFNTGGTIEVNPGTWTDGAEVAIVWMRNGEEFATTTADETSYVLTQEDYGTRLSVDIQVTALGYKDLTYKMKSRTIKIGVITEVPTPVISGDAVVDGTLEVEVGEYPEGAEFQYVWKRNGRVISGANEASYTVIARDVNTTISVKVVATIPGYKITRIDSEGVEVTPAQ